jgi:energy-coupling factor transporter ATP-binding protein EcfA2
LALREFDLEPLRSTPPHEMSGGEKARLALACVWVMQPRCLVLDETESLLDRRGREHLAATMARLPATTTILQVTTDAETAATCPRVLVVHAGRLVADGPPDEVFATVSEEVLVRIGSPLAWRVSNSLQTAPLARSRTASMERLFERLGRSRPAASISDVAPVEPE